MNAQIDQQRQTVTVSVMELEDIIQRTVRETVREEVSRMLHKHLPAIRYYLFHEGADNPQDEEQLLQEALDALEYARAHPETVQPWAEVKAELERAEAAGELPA